MRSITESNNSKMGSLVVELSYEAETEEEAKLVWSSVQPELRDWRRDRSDLTIRVDGKIVCAYIHATAISETRAAVNTVGSWLTLAARVANVR